MTNKAEDSGADTTEVEVALQPVRTGRRGAGALAIGAILGMIGLLLAGAYLATADGDSPVDVASDDDASADVDVDTEPSEDGGDGEDAVGDADDDAVGEDEPDGRLAGDEAIDGAVSEEGMDVVFEASETAFYGESGGSVVYTGSQFVSVGFSEGGQTLRTSDDGVSWDEEPFPGLPDRASVVDIDEHDGTVVVLLEQWNEPDEVSTEGEFAEFFRSAGTSTYSLASSTDLASWNLAELPAPEATDRPTYVSISGLALGDAGVVMFSQTQEEGEDELRVLFDAGILDESTIQNYCGIDTSTDGQLDVQLCDFEEDGSIWMEFDEALAAAETDEERAEVERSFDDSFVESVPDVIATISAGDPLYERLSSIYDGSGEQFPSIDALFGPVEGPFERVRIGENGYPVSFTEVGGSYVAVLHRWDDNPDSGPTAIVIGSVDGVNWSVNGSLPAPGFSQLFVVDGALVAVGGEENGQPLVMTSDDLGSSWSASALTTGLFDAYALGADGPAGIAVLVQGGTEPYPDFTFPDPLSITKDGFTMTTTFTEMGGGTVTLTGPDGVEIMSFSEEELYGDENNGFVRFGRLSGNQTFLDPETGEDLVTITSRDMEEAYREIEPAEPEEIERRFELSFSADGRNWTVLDDPRLDVDSTQSHLELLAVGDDEVILRKDTWTNPPEELFAFEMDGRDPTDDEERAIDAWYEANGEGQQTEYLSVPVQG